MKKVIEEIVKDSKDTSGKERIFQLKKALIAKREML
jgi:hypothetical protein